MEEALDGYQGLLKAQVAGPWTLAATLEQPRSLNPALADPGLVADLATSLAEGAAAHVAEVTKRIPGATIIVQLARAAPPSFAAVKGSPVACPASARWTCSRETLHVPRGPGR